MTELAPVLVFAYNRPQLLRQTLDALSANYLADQSHLFIYADGPKANATAEQIENIKQVRALAREKQWCAKVTIREAEKNKGLADSVIGGVSEIVNEFGKVIIIEDDVVTSRYFLQFMNEALDIYANEKRVLSVSSWNYFAAKAKTNGNFFMHMPDTIAWATWKRAWKLFEYDAAKLQEQLLEKGLMKKFNLGSRYNFQDLLQAQINSKVSSWGIRWTAVAVLNNTLSFYPEVSLSKHIGFGADATHSKEADYNQELVLASSPIPVKKILLEESSVAVNEWLRFEKDVKRSPALIDRSLVPRKARFIFSILKHKLAKKIILPLLNAVSNSKQSKAGWSGNFKSWTEAERKSIGYDAANILETVKKSTLKVKNGEAAYERDSVIFDKVQYSPELLETLKTIAEENGKQLQIVDFGGSLGSSYFQHKALLNGTVALNWQVVEQPHFVDCGRKELANHELKFEYSIEEALKASRPQVLLLSSVVQYMKEPYIFISNFLSYGFLYIIVDRTAFIEGEEERITVQVVPEEIYKASYPAWFLNEAKFISAFSAGYELVKSFDSYCDPKELMDGKLTYRKGFVFKRVLE